LSALRTISIRLDDAVTLIKPKLLAADAAILRAALKTHYDDASWLGVLKNIMDPLRLRKRDALVNYIIATNQSLTSSNYLYDYFLYRRGNRLRDVDIANYSGSRDGATVCPTLPHGSGTYVRCRRRG
jgi:hypothetical protein